MSAAALLAGYGADLLVGDPSRFHPVAGFGAVAAALEQAAYAPTRLRGALVAGGLVASAAAGAEALAHGSRRPVAMLALTWTALGGHSLRREARRLAGQLAADDLDGARAALRALCGREASQLDETDLCRAVVESLAENTSDAVVGALLWGALGGPAGVTAYRAANTLDAMFGHRNERYEHFGWFAARLDDVLNWPAARLAAAIVCAAAGCVGGSPAVTLATVRRDGPHHPSPNAGRIEAAFAGALGIQLGGPLAYGTRTEQRPILGDGRAPDLNDITRAAQLSLIVSSVAALLCAGLRRAASPR
ncbi:MAG TPA: adenosylcobinamide-phosphate synthase CbiB [Solirubrobacteraceae bacterium]|nr:adenosylcobinamide-phosphate synthase CbiB [Solirubrobacteraceae bacterium]